MSNFEFNEACQMKFYIGVTDQSWYSYLSRLNPEDINFWQPGGGAFKVINPGAPFLFKLKSPIHAIAGVGFFFRHSVLPISIAWETFGVRNGCQSFRELQRLILNYRGDKSDLNPPIGCIVLNAPIFFDQNDWIPIPNNWSNSIVKGKSYSTDESIGREIWSRVEVLIEKYLFSSPGVDKVSLVEDPSADTPAYSSILSKVRIGQGAFRVGVIDAYQKHCSVSGEKTLPVLEAAHIMPYALTGQNEISNGILLRSDIHKLFDQGYITITPDYTVEISKRIKEEFENGREYYQHHGKPLLYIPSSNLEQPNTKHLIWHNETVYRG